MTFWAVWNAWNRVRRVLYLTYLQQLTLAAMTRKGESPGEESVGSGRLKWRKCGWQKRWAASLWLGKPSPFYCRIWSKDVFVMTHGVYEILRQYQGTKRFPPDQQLRLVAPGWRVLDFEGNVMREEEVEPQRERILRAPQVMKDREYPFSEVLFVDSSGSVDGSLPVLANVSALLEALRVGGSYGLVHQLWSQFTLIAGQVNVDVTWSRDEVLVSGFIFPYCT